jgi:hypothetical protein
MKLRRVNDRLLGSHPFDYIDCAVRRALSGMVDAWRTVWFDEMNETEHAMFEAWLRAIGDERPGKAGFAAHVEKELAVRKAQGAKVTHRTPRR